MTPSVAEQVKARAEARAKRKANKPPQSVDERIVSLVRLQAKVKFMDSYPIWDEILTHWPEKKELILNTILEMGKEQ